MVRIASLVFFLAFAFNAFAQKPSIEFDADIHDFGEIEEGTLAEYEFTFTNTGDAPLVITDVQRACGCTTPTWTKEPVKPGETGKIKAVYNSNGRPGTFNKDITVITNDPKNGKKKLYIKGNVKPKG